MQFARRTNSKVWLLVMSLCFFFWSQKTTAHVKWFAEYDLASPPRSLAQIIYGQYFLVFVFFTTVLMLLVLYVDTELNQRSNWIVSYTKRVSNTVQPWFSVTIRAGVCAFFLAAAAYGGFILTPELKTDQAWVTIVQLVIAALVLLSSTAIVAGGLMILLFIYAVTQYGLYHLLDYPIFIGVAVFIILSRLGQNYFTVALNVMRWCTGITLMWAGIEKFAYPEWSFVLLEKNPELTFGFDHEFYMVAAGFVEFCCAYLLIAGMLAARVAAAILLFLFTSAIYYFGLIDAIGHSVIIVVLTLLILSENSIELPLKSRSPVRTAVTQTAFFLVSLGIFLGAYNVGHSVSYPTPIASNAALR